MFIKCICPDLCVHMHGKTSWASLSSYLHVFGLYLLRGLSSQGEMVPTGNTVLIRWPGIRVFLSYLGIIMPINWHEVVNN